MSDRDSVLPSDYDPNAKEAIQFVNDMIDSGLEPFHYHGRFFWEGPAVVVSDIYEAMSVTSVPCQWDNMGLNWVVYPNTTGKLNDIQEDEDV